MVSRTEEDLVKTWCETVTEDLKTWNIDANNAHDRPVWKKAL